MEHGVIERDQSASCDERFHLERYWRAENSIREGLHTLMERHRDFWNEIDVDIDRECDRESVPIPLT